MSDTFITLAESDAHLEQARHAAQGAAGKLDAVKAATDAAHAEQARLDALPSLTDADLLAAENTRRYLRTLDSERVQAEAALDSARSALADAERARARAHMIDVLGEIDPLAASIEKDLDKMVDKLRAKVVGLRERVDAAREWAYQAEDPSPELEGMAHHLARIDPDAGDGAFLAALGAALDARAERIAWEAQCRADEIKQRAEKARREAERAAWNALPQAEKDARLLDDFDAAVVRFRRSSPGYDRATTHALVAQYGWACPSAGTGVISHRNPYASDVPVEVPAAVSEAEVLLQRHHERQAQGAAQQSGDHDPFAKD